MTSEPYFTHAMWRVRAGREAEFVRVWREELSRAFLAANPAASGTLIQSLDDPQLFYSFGPWASLEAMQNARAHPEVRRAVSTLLELCESAAPGAYRSVLRMP